MESKEKFRIYIKHIMYKYKKKRYLSKNNQNIRRVLFLANLFPKAKVLIPFRNPVQHAYSLLNQHKRFIQLSKNDLFISKYMKWIGHTEFGPNYIPIQTKKIFFDNDFDINHWIEQWYLTYNFCLKNLLNKNNVNFICYEKLCNSEEYWLDILNLLEIKDNYNFPFKQISKKVNLEINEKLLNKSISLYSDLCKLKLTK